MENDKFIKVNKIDFMFVFKGYRILFQSIFLLFERIRKYDDINDWNAIILLSFLEFLNILVIIQLFGLTKLFNVTDGKYKLLYVVLFFIVVFINYLLLIRNSDTKEDFFEKINHSKSLILLLPLLYATISAIMFIVIWVGV